MVKVSVVVPIYNAELYLSKCLDSVLEQTLKEIEVIMVDDASIDNSIEIAKAYAQKDNRVRVLHSSKNLGPMIAREKGYLEATGKYVFFCDNDDTLPIDALQILYNEAERKKADIVMGETVSLVQNQEIACSCNHIKREKAYIDSILDNDLPNRMWGKLYRTELLLRAEIPAIPHFTLGDDWFFNLMIAKHVKQWHRIKNIVYNYNLRKNSITRTPLTTDYAELYFQAARHIWNRYKQYPHIKDRIEKELALGCTELLLRGFSLTTISNAANKHKLHWLLKTINNIIPQK